MTSNVEIVRETLEQIVNQKQIDAWDDFFSPDYIARTAPSIGLGFSIDSSGDTHVVRFIVPGSPADELLEVDDQILWAEDSQQRWDAFEEIAVGVQSHHGSQLKLGIRRDTENLEISISRGPMPGYETDCEQAKAEMRDFMTRQIPDLTVEILQTIADGDTVACLMDYRGTHAEFKREAIWREAWFARLDDGKIIESWPLPDIDAYCRQLGYRMTAPNP